MIEEPKEEYAEAYFGGPKKAAMSFDGRMISDNQDRQEANYVKLAKAMQSKRIKGFEHMFSSAHGDIIEPPFNPLEIAYFKLNNIWHSLCINKKATVGAKSGYKIVSRDEGKELSPKRIKQVKDFLEFGSNEGDTHYNFSSLLYALWKDKENLGSSNIEVLRDTQGRPFKWFHVSALTVRKAASKPGFYQLSFIYNPDLQGDRTGRNALNLMHNVGHSSALLRKVYFKEYGNQEGYSIRGNRRSPNIRGANELIQYRTYDATSPWYGIPNWIPALTHVLADESSIQWNLDFFRKHKIPNFLFKLKGAKFKSDTKGNITQFFNSESMPNEPLVISIPSGDLEVQKLSDDTKDGQFGDLQDKMRDAIAASHEVPLSILGIDLTGKLGGGNSNREQRTNFKTTVIDPRQKEIIEPFNDKILPDAGFEDAIIQLNPFDDSDAEEYAQESNTSRENWKCGVITMNEARRKLRLDPIKEEWANKHVFVTNNQIFDLKEHFSTFVEESKEKSKTQNSLSRMKQRLAQ